jgi:hypothetical protein
MPSPTEAALTEILREFGLPACNEDAVAQYMASRGVEVKDASAAASVSTLLDTVPDHLWDFHALMCGAAGHGLMFRREVYRLAEWVERLARGEAAA